MEKTEISSLLNSRKLRSTKIRQDVLSLIKNSGRAVSQSKIQKFLGEFDRVTLYRTLNVLEDKGILHKAYTENNETYFAICTSNCSSQNHQHKHIHFKCEKCLVVKCVKPQKSIEIDLPNFQINSLNVEVTGVCDNCLLN